MSQIERLFTSPSSKENVRSLRSEWISDMLNAAAWTVFLGIPLFVVHMLMFDYEHFLMGGTDSFSLSMSLSNIIPRHPLSLELWLVAVFITAVSIRHSSRQREQMAVMDERLVISQTQSLTDCLTGIWNRRGLDQLLKIGLNDARKSRRPFSIILADVDGLKHYNDTYGHPKADEALRQIAALMASSIRSADAAARYGGDEFAILCPDLNHESAQSMVIRLREVMCAAPLTLSFGVATYPVHGKSDQELIEAADQRLYLAKSQRSQMQHSLDQ